jgi:hypothetical protein
MGDTGMIENNLDPELKEKIRPTKAWLEEQVASCRAAIERNIGAMNFCLSMLKSDVYCEEEENQKSTEIK